MTEKSWENKPEWVLCDYHDVTYRIPGKFSQCPVCEMESEVELADETIAEQAKRITILETDNEILWEIYSETKSLHPWDLIKRFLRFLRVFRSPGPGI